MMKRIFVSVITVIVLCVPAAPGWSAEGMQDESSTAFSSAPTVSITATPSFLFSGVAHAANGVALRETCRGTIPLRGIAPGSMVTTALLYWNFMNSSATGASTDTELFNGNLVTGLKVADQPDLCWDTAGDHTYRAVVTPFISPSQGPGDYTFSALTCNDTQGGNPWLTSSKSPVLWEGASLIAAYKNPGTRGDRVAVFDNLAGAANGSGAFHSFSVNMSTGSAIAFSGMGLFTQVGADGQTGMSFDNSATGETDTFNDILLAGPGGRYPQSNWDGSSGWPQPQLWDTHTLDVSFNGTSINTDTTTVTTPFSASTDCIAAVVYVEQQGGR